MNSLLVLAAATTASFNLFCNGTETQQDIANGLPNHVETAPRSDRFSATYRIDLRSRRWCPGNCSSTSQIHSITNQYIILQYGTRAPYVITTLNRESGTFIEEFYSGTIKHTKLGTCRRGRFTGFPALQF